MTHRRPDAKSPSASLALLALAALLTAGVPARAVGLLAQARGTPTGGETNWLLIGGIGIGVIVVIGIVIVVLGGQGGGKDKKKSSRVVVSETQVDNYRLMNLMMTGQTSQVWESAEVSSGRHFALKMLLPENVHSVEHRHYLFHEFEVGKQIVHPNIIKMLEAVRDRDHPYLLMEFFPSTNLKLRLMRKDPFIKENFKTIVEKTSLALAFMHEKGWVHRDVKPDNILLNASADVRLIDFALSQRLSSKKPSRFARKSGKSQGTRSYMSPEQIRGEPLDARADVYSFGITLYELLTGRPPFRAATPGDLLSKQLYEKPAPPDAYNADITRDMSELIVAMLSKRRDDRPRDMHAFIMKFRGMRFFKPPTPAKKKESEG